MINDSSFADNRDNGYNKTMKKHSIVKVTWTESFSEPGHHVLVGFAKDGFGCGCCGSSVVRVHCEDYGPFVAECEACCECLNLDSFKDRTVKALIDRVSRLDVLND